MSCTDGAEEATLGIGVETALAGPRLIMRRGTAQVDLRAANSITSVGPKRMPGPVVSRVSAFYGGWGNFNLPHPPP